MGGLAGAESVLASALPVIAVLLAALGAADALFFVLVGARRLPPDPRWLPRVCRMDEGTCARLLDTPEARLLGVPNAAFGLAYYVGIAAAAAWALATGAWPPCALLLLPSLGAVAMSAALAWALLVRLRARCALCFLGHGINAALLVVVLAACLA